LVAQYEYVQTTFQLTDSNKRRNDTDQVWYHAQPWLVFFVCSFIFYNAQFDMEISKIQKNKPDQWQIACSLCSIRSMVLFYSFLLYAQKNLFRHLK